MEITTENVEVFLAIEEILHEFIQLVSMVMAMVVTINKYKRQVIGDRGIINVIARMENLDRFINKGDIVCVDQLRMDRNTFGILCTLIRTIGQLQDSRHVTVEEQVAMFLHILAHHVKNRVIKSRFIRSGETVSRHFNAVLKAVMKLHRVLLRAPEPIRENCADDRWRWFKNCLGALDGTYVKVHVPELEKPRYRSRKGELATNVFGVCANDMKFIYVLPGWEGSAADSRVLRDAVTRPNGLRVPTGYYYLVDDGYTNGEGFLAPYRGQKYHLSTWRDGPAPSTPQEFFNMKHASARNVIERCFGLLKLRWAILRSPSFFPIRTQNRIITACCLIHNLIRREMSADPLENELDAHSPPFELGDEYIDTVETSNQWSDWRDNLANQMFNEWMANRGQAH